MPAATPKPSLEDLLTILSRCSELRANYSDINDPNSIELCFKFKKEHLGPAAQFVFSYPSTILPTLIELLQFDDALEKEFRRGDPRNTIDHVISYIDQKLKMVNSVGSMGIEGRLDSAFLQATLKYLRELDRRRREADRRTKEAEELNRKREEEEIRRRVEEAILREKQEKQRAKEEARARWEREEAEKAKRDSKRTSDSGTYGNAHYGNSWDKHFFEEMLRASGMNRESFRKKFYQEWGDPFNESHKTTPPPSGKRRWYEVLGCPPGANRDQIRRAAREAAKGLHPDTSTDPQAKEKFQAISEAKAEGLAGCI